jgi:spermidine synthase
VTESAAYGSDLKPRHPRIEFIDDDDRPGGVMLVMDAVRQSYVDIDDPLYLDFEYVQFFASALAIWRPGPLAVTHIGGGALTIPRFLAVARPGSSQIVLEPDVELTALVRARLPLPREHRIRVRGVDGRQGLAQLKSDSADVVVLDAYADGKVPPGLTTAESFAEIARVLRPHGLLLANLVDEPGFHYLRRVAAGLRVVFADLALVAAHDVLKGRRFGNVVFIAGQEPFDTARLRTEIVQQPFPAGVRDDLQLRDLLGRSEPFTDADNSPSPEPNRGGWRIL